MVQVVRRGFSVTIYLVAVLYIFLTLLLPHNAFLLVSFFSAPVVVILLSIATANMKIGVRSAESPAPTFYFRSFERIHRIAASSIFAAGFLSLVVFMALSGYTALKFAGLSFLFFVWFVFAFAIMVLSGVLERAAEGISKVAAHGLRNFYLRLRARGHAGFFHLHGSRPGTFRG